MLDLDEQLRHYFDATATAADVERPYEEGDVVVLLDERSTRRPRRLRVLVAAALVAVVGVAGVVLLQDEDSRTRVDDDPAVDRPDPLPSVVETPAELTWTESPYSPEQDASVFVGDGERFFLIGSRLESSLNGSAWETIEMRDMPLPETLSGTWTNSAAASGRILHLVVREGRASTFLFDVAGGQVREAVLPFASTADSDIRGFVALNGEGRAVALIYDLAVTPMRTAAFSSADGVDWSPIPAGQLPEAQILDPVALGEGFFVAAVWPTRSATYWYSDDGAQWSAIESEGALDSLLPWGDIVVAEGTESGAAPRAYQLTEAGSSQLDVDLSPLRVFGYYPIVAAGEFGLAGVSPTGHPAGDPPQDGTWFVNYSVDGLTWTRRTLPFPDGPYIPEVVASADRVLIRADGDLWIGTLR